MTGASDIVMVILLALLVVCAVSAALSRNLLVAVIIFMAYSLIMSVVWILLRAPDLAITEAAVGAGVTTILLFITLRRIDRIKREKEDDDREENEL